MIYFPDTCCVKNKKSFLGIKYHGDHDMQITHISKFMDCSEHFMVVAYCNRCGIRQKRNFVSWGELMQEGFTAAELGEIGVYGKYYESQNSEATQ